MPTPVATQPAATDTINNLIEKSPQQWHTTIGLPFRRIEGTVIEWDEYAAAAAAARLHRRMPVCWDRTHVWSSRRSQDPLRRAADEPCSV
tara:strand:+ start:101 stop:370 length:270 start_codon:yes stop_codon:yes gene_type:complete